MPCTNIRAENTRRIYLLARRKTVRRLSPYIPFSSISKLRRTGTKIALSLLVFAGMTSGQHRREYPQYCGEPIWICVCRLKEGLEIEAEEIKVFERYDAVRAKREELQRSWDAYDNGPLPSRMEPC